MTNFFEDMERNLGLGVFFAQSFITGAIASNKGWGQRADEWVEDLKSDLAGDREKVRDLADEVEAGVDDFLETVAKAINTYLDGKYQPEDDADVADFLDEDEREAEADVAEDEQATSRAREFITDLLRNANLADVAEKTDKVETSETSTSVAKDDAEKALTREFVESSVNAREFTALTEKVKVIVDRVQEAHANADTAEVNRLTELLKDAGISVTFSGRRVLWHIMP